MCGENGDCRTDCTELKRLKKELEEAKQNVTDWKHNCEDSDELIASLRKELTTVHEGAKLSIMAANIFKRLHKGG